MDTILDEKKYISAISGIITPDEINQFFILRQKMIQAENTLIDIEQDVLSQIQENAKKEFDGPVPYMVTITISSDVIIPQSKPDEAATPIENKAQSYVIEFTDKGYEKLISLIYDKFTDLLSSACKDLVKKPEDTNNVNNSSETRTDQ